jgi:hypothetical protein
MALTEAVETALDEAGAAVRRWIGNHVQRSNVPGPGTQHDDDTLIALGRRQDLPLDHRIGAEHARHRLKLAHQRIDTLGIEITCIDIDMRLKAEQLAEELRPETVHDRHDSDQAENGQGDPAKGDHGNQCDAAMLPPGPQIAEGQHEFIGREGACAPGCTDCGISHRQKPFRRDG